MENTAGPACDLKTLQHFYNLNKQGACTYNLHVPAGKLDHLLAKFLKDICKINGEKYDPDTLLLVSGET